MIPPSAWPTRDTTPARSWRTWTEGRGRPELPNRSAGASRAGTGARTRAGRFTTTARGCAQRWVSRPCANGGELVERSFAHILDRGGLRRTWLRGRENVHKRYLIHVAGHNL